MWPVGALVWAALPFCSRDKRAPRILELRKFFFQTVSLRLGSALQECPQEARSAAPWVKGSVSLILAPAGPPDVPGRPLLQRADLVDKHLAQPPRRCWGRRRRSRIAWKILDRTRASTDLLVQEYTFNQNSKLYIKPLWAPLHDVRNRLQLPVVWKFWALTTAKA